MMEFVLLASLGGYPRVYANEYCWERHFGATHEEAVAHASEIASTTDTTFVADYCSTIYLPYAEEDR